MDVGAVMVLVEVEVVVTVLVMAAGVTTCSSKGQRILEMDVTERASAYCPGSDDYCLRSSTCS